MFFRQLLVNQVYYNRKIWLTLQYVHFVYESYRDCLVLDLFWFCGIHNTVKLGYNELSYNEHLVITSKIIYLVGLGHFYYDYDNEQNPVITNIIWQKYQKSYDIGWKS